MIALTDDDAAAFRVGYREGWREGRGGSRRAPAEYYGDAWTKWRRSGWIIGNDDAFQGLDEEGAGKRARVLGLPVSANPWLPDEPGHASHITGWSSVEPSALRWGVTP